MYLYEMLEPSLLLPLVCHALQSGPRDQRLHSLSDTEFVFGTRTIVHVFFPFPPDQRSETGQGETCLVAAWENSLQDGEGRVCSYEGGGRDGFAEENGDEGEGLDA